MKIKKPTVYYIVSAALTVTLSLLLRFLYKVTPGIISGILSSANNSIFEQMKSVLWPCVLFMIMHEVVFHNGNFEEHSLYLLLSLFSVPLSIMIIRKLQVENLTAVNVISSILGIIVFFTLCYVNGTIRIPLSMFEIVSAPILMIAVIIIFIAFSFNPPQNELFFDPINKLYGMPHLQAYITGQQVYT